MVAAGAYALWLDRQVAATFAERQWSLPARVYARPLELYAGASVGRARVQQELDILGYQRVGRPRSQGQYAASAQRLEILTRGFEFWDGAETPQRIRVEFLPDRISALTDAATGNELDLLRLEPAEIGRINPRRFEDRQLLSYAELPDNFVRTLIAVEDRRFYEHHGIDFVGLARAMMSNLRAMRFVQGGSTLTQQLVKNFYLTRERTLSRKLTEMVMAVSLESRHDKNEILETYVNEVFLGQDGNRAIHGFGLAARFYFGRPLSELSLQDMALLVGLAKGPSAYDPRRRPEAARQRRDVVLGIMATRKLISASQLEQLRSAPIRLREADAASARANPAFMDLLTRQLRAEYSTEDLNSAGLSIFTTLDVVLQTAVEKAVRTSTATIEQAVAAATKLQAAAVVLEPRSGEILALVGDRNAGYSGFNRALDARRPIGSTIKPFIYAEALSQPQRFSLATLLPDRSVVWNNARGEAWTPKNYDGLEHGDLSLLDALTRSLNLATVNLGLQLGLDSVSEYLYSFGLPTRPAPYPSLLLGALELSPLQLAELYTALANDGFQVPARAILSVTNQQQRKLSRYGLKVRPVMTPATAALVRYALMRVVTRGTARRLAEDYRNVMPLAGKTGTTNDNRDSWFAGFGSNRLAISWVGRDDNQASGLTGSSGALQVWKALMRSSGVQPLDPALPSELRLQPVDLRRGVVVPAYCNNAELIPVHELSQLPHSEACVGTVNALAAPASTEPPSAAPGLIDRIRSWF